jgi:hypothetical protein
MDLAPPPPPRGLLPAAYDDAVHATRCLAQLRSKGKPIEQYIYLSQLKHANEDLFYRLCLANMQVSNDQTRSHHNHTDLGVGIHTYHIYPHCWGRLPSAFPHLPTARRLGTLWSVSSPNFTNRFALVHLHQGYGQDWRDFEELAA